MKFSELASDGARLTDGVWREFSPGFDVKLKPVGNRDYDLELQRVARKARKGARLGRVDDEALALMTMKATARCVLVGWKGLTDDDDQPIEYSAKTALDLFDKNHRFYKTIVEMATDLQDDDDDDLQDEAGN